MKLIQLHSITKSNIPSIKKNKGFTLIELLIVLAIIGMLAALVGPRLMSSLTKSQTKTTRSQMELLITSLDSFRLDNGRYPTQQEGLAALINKPDGLINWNGPYLRKKLVPKDAWGFDFSYAIPASKGGLEFDLYSLGADNKEGGEAENSDVGNWQ